MEHSPSSASGLWRPLDEAVALTFRSSAGEPQPALLHWRGSPWRVVGIVRHWSTWRALPVRPSPDEPPVARGLRVDFWRFRAQADPLSPVLSFEIRRAGPEWRLVRLAGTFDVPREEPPPRSRCRERH